MSLGHGCDGQIPFSMSRRNSTFWSKVGEMGVGETGVGEMGVGEMGVGETGVGQTPLFGQK